MVAVAQSKMIASGGDGKKWLDLFIFFKFYLEGGVNMLT